MDFLRDLFGRKQTTALPSDKTSIKTDGQPASDLANIVSNLKEVSWSSQEAIKLKSAIKNTWVVDWQVFSLTKKQVQLLSQSMPLDTKFYEIDGQYQIKLSPNSIFIHAFGSYIDIGYVMFLYKNKIYYVNIDPTVKLTTFIFERMDDLSHMAKIAITLNNLIGNQRKNILIKLEGTLAQAK